jgi:starvation-inducible DNA-binding protein
MKLTIGISEERLKVCVTILANLLADEMVLYIKTRKFHWNVSGQSFMELHKLFQAQYTEFEKVIDEIAERIGKLGSNIIGTMSEYSALTRLKESPKVYAPQKEMLIELKNDHEILILELRKGIEECVVNRDAGTADFLTGLLLQHETSAWIFSRYLN